MTREEAIRRIKAWNLDSDDMEVLSAVIPELAESEDERIRKALVNEISGWSDVYKMFKYAPKEKVLAWFEKQKEPIDPFDTKLFQDGVKEGRRLEREDIKKEQKPAEWSKEDNIGWGEAFACVTLAEKAAKNEEELQNAVTAEKWLKEIKFKYYVHPVKQEWSAENEDKLYQIIETLLADKEIACRDNPQHYDVLCKAYDEQIAWLKSLCPSWKPSEEQMQYLLAVINDPNNAGAESCHLILESLYNDLKEL